MIPVLSLLPKTWKTIIKNGLFQESVGKYYAGTDIVFYIKWQMHTNSTTAKCYMAISHHSSADYSVFIAIYFIYTVFAMCGLQKIDQVSNLKHNRKAFKIMFISIQ